MHQRRVNDIALGRPAGARSRDRRSQQERPSEWMPARARAAGHAAIWSPERSAERASGRVQHRHRHCARFGPEAHLRLATGRRPRRVDHDRSVLERRADIDRPACSHQRRSERDREHGRIVLDDEHPAGRGPDLALGLAGQRREGRRQGIPDPPELGGGRRRQAGDRAAAARARGTRSVTRGRGRGPGGRSRRRGRRARAGTEDKDENETEAEEDGGGGPAAEGGHATIVPDGTSGTAAVPQHDDGPWPPDPLTRSAAGRHRSCDRCRPVVPSPQAEDGVWFSAGLQPGPRAPPAG